MQAIKRTFNFINTHPLAKRHRLIAFGKFVLWQIKSRCYRGNIIVPFIGKTVVIAKRGLTGITGNIYTGLHEFEDMSFLLHFLREREVFFDIGANVGSYTVLASGVRKARTVAFEPIKSTFEILEQNVAINNLGSFVKCENKGLSNEFGTVLFTSKEDTTNHIVPDNQNSDDSVIVQVVQLDSYYPDYTPVLLKIDVEGFETKVLNGANKILEDKHLKAIIIELNGSGGRYGFDEKNIHEKLLSLSFKPYTYYPFERKLEEQENFGLFNTIYVRDLDFVLDRLKEAAPFSVFNENI